MNYFSESHELLREAVRDFVETEVKPHIEEWEENELFPVEMYKKAAERDILGVNFPEEYGGVGGDVFHGIVVTEEMFRSTSGGFGAGMGSHAIGLPPILRMGTEEQKRRFIPPVLAGDKIAALAVSEPDAGSDVAGIRTRAERDGDHYIVNGAKIFITSGVRADYLTTAVRTGGPGHDGISLLVIPTDIPGVRVSKALKKMGWRCSDTAELAFEDARVPAENLIGGEGNGFKAIMVNFQPERLSMAVMAYVTAELAYEEALAHARVRQTFGKPLVARQVIRHKLVEMLGKIRVAKNFVYSVAARVQTGEDCVMDVSIAKNFATKVCEEVTYEAVQICGGMGFMRGTVVERLYRDTRILSIGGGTHEIMNEIISKQAGIG
ncbi:MAG: acyl-CoA dehydrogenase family protein [Acidobacteriota bacterium]|nr:acyl-CoA dehydrogenase family protein [Acidobacteriota bacterium]